MIAETFTQLLRDPAHWLFELTVELVTGVFIGALVWPWAMRRWHKRHDRKVHKEIFPVERLTVDEEVRRALLLKEEPFKGPVGYIVPHSEP